MQRATFERLWRHGWILDGFDGLGKHFVGAGHLRGLRAFAALYRGSVVWCEWHDAGAGFGRPPARLVVKNQSRLVRRAASGCGFCKGVRCACTCISDRKIGQAGTRRSRAAACSAAAQNAARPAVSCGSGGCGRAALRCRARGRWPRQSAAGAAPRHARDTLRARERAAEVLLRARFLCAGRRGAGYAAWTRRQVYRALCSHVSQAPNSAGRLRRAARALGGARRASKPHICTRQAADAWDPRVDLPAARPRWQRARCCAFERGKSSGPQKIQFLLLDVVRICGLLWGLLTARAEPGCARRTCRKNPGEIWARSREVPPPAASSEWPGARRSGVGGR